jgi:hypothetical protein
MRSFYFDIEMLYFLLNIPQVMKPDLVDLNFYAKFHLVKLPFKLYIVEEFGDSLLHEASKNTSQATAKC